MTQRGQWQQADNIAKNARWGHQVALCRCAGLKEPPCLHAPYSRCLADIKPEEVLRAPDPFQLS